MAKSELVSDDSRTAFDVVDVHDGPRPRPARLGWLFPTEADGPDLSGLSVLLAEDRPDRRELADRLKRLGAEVTLECSGRSAFAAAMKRLWGGRTFDAVVLDLRDDPTEAAVIAAALRDGHYEGPLVAVVGGPTRIPPALWRKAAFTAVARRACPEAEVPAMLAR